MKTRVVCAVLLTPLAGASTAQMKAPVPEKKGELSTIPMNQQLGGRSERGQQVLAPQPLSPFDSIDFGQDRRSERFAKKTPFVKLPSAISDFNQGRKTNEENLKNIDELLSQVKPGQKTISIGDSSLQVDRLKGLRKEISRYLNSNSVSSPGSISGLSSGPTNAWDLRWFPSVPYVFNSNVTDVSIRNAYMRAMSDLEDSSAIDFSPRTNESAFLNLQQVSGNTSSSQNIGKGSGSQFIRVATGESVDTRRNVAIHELLHGAGGLFHEHQRTDRDTWITVNSSNIAQNSSQFSKLGNVLYFSGYDLLSVMHYSRNQFAYLNTDTITVNGSNNAYYQDKIGISKLTPAGRTLGDGDRDAMATLYGWPQVCLSWNQSEMNHQTGQADGDGWSAVVGRDSPYTFMTYGPYTKTVAAGNQAAIFEVAVGNISGNNDLVGIIEVYNASKNYIANQLPLYKSYFPAANVYIPFMRYFSCMNITAPSPATPFPPSTPYELEDLWEFRVFWIGNTNLKVRNIGITRPEWNADEMSHVPQTGSIVNENTSGINGTVDMPLTANVWRSLPGVHSESFMAYGPYTNKVQSGFHTAFFTLDLLTGTNQSPNPIVRLESFDATTGTVLASKNLYSGDIALGTKWARYELPFSFDTNRVGHLVELRVWWYNNQPARFYSAGIL